MSIGQKVTGLSVAILSIALAAGAASAAVVGFSPLANLTNDDYTVDFDGTTSYTFSNSGQGGSFGFG